MDDCQDCGNCDKCVEYATDCICNYHVKPVCRKCENELDYCECKIVDNILLGNIFFLVG